MITFIYHYPITCINRNIVECKVKKESDELKAALVLIETLWNVKLFEADT